VDEIKLTIKYSSRWKAPGPDGLPNEFYKTFADDVMLPLRKFFQECEEQNQMPHSFGLSRVVLLYKKDN
jgi:hypothetical protein